MKPVDHIFLDLESQSGKDLTDAELVLAMKAVMGILRERFRQDALTRFRVFSKDLGSVDLRLALLDILEQPVNTLLDVTTVAEDYFK